MDIDWTRLQQDETYRQEVFDDIFRDCHQMVFHWCVRRLGEEIGEDIAQDVFLTAWKTLPKFRQASLISTWLIGIAKKKCMQAIRNCTVRKALARKFQDDIRQQAHTNASAICQEQLLRLADSLAQLREVEQILLNMRYTKELPIDKIAELLVQDHETYCAMGSSSSQS